VKNTSRKYQEILGGKAIKTGLKIIYFKNLLTPLCVTQWYLDNGKRHTKLVGKLPKENLIWNLR
jgi:hypothetical protein